jgi:nascent polypeptide-associated complex subunit alpha
MIPGLGAGNPRQMALMMKKLGIDVLDIPNVLEVIVKTADKDYVFKDASVSVMKAQGVETWQLSGTPDVVEHEVRLVVSDDDVKMVMEQTGAKKVAARKALEAHNGDLAAAILALSDG